MRATAERLCPSGDPDDTLVLTCDGKTIVMAPGRCAPPPPRPPNRPPQAADQVVAGREAQPQANGSTTLCQLYVAGEGAIAMPAADAPDTIMATAHVRNTHVPGPGTSTSSSSTRIAPCRGCVGAGETFH
jgi:hypothetical protein